MFLQIQTISKFNSKAYRRAFRLLKKQHFFYQKYSSKYHLILQKTTQKQLQNNCNTLSIIKNSYQKPECSDERAKRARGDRIQIPRSADFWLSIFPPFFFKIADRTVWNKSVFFLQLYDLYTLFCFDDVTEIVSHLRSVIFCFIFSIIW